MTKLLNNIEMTILSKRLAVPCGSSSVVERNVANVLVLGLNPARNLNNLRSMPYWDAMWDAVGLINERKSRWLTYESTERKYRLLSG